MSETFALLLAWLAGVALGAVFFGGLWWTVRRSLASSRPALWILVSLPLRLAITLTGLWFIGSGHLVRLIAGLVGLIMARFLVTWLTRPQGAGHAP